MTKTPLRWSPLVWAIGVAGFSVGIDQEMPAMAAGGFGVMVLGAAGIGA